MPTKVDRILKDAQTELKRLRNATKEEVEGLIGFDWRVQERLHVFAADAWHVVEEVSKRLQALHLHDVDLPQRPAPSRRLAAGVSAVNQKRPSNPREWSEGLPCEVCGEHRATNVCHIVPRSLRGKLEPDNLLILCPTHHFLFDHSRMTRREFSRLNVSEKAPDAQRYFEKVLVARQQMFWRYGASRQTGCGRCRQTDMEFVVVEEHGALEVSLKCRDCGARQSPYALVDFHPLAGLSVQASVLVGQEGMSEEEARAEIVRRKEHALEWISNWDGGDLF